MAQITVYYKAASGNWNDADGWNDAANGSGTDYTNPQNGANTFICNLNGKAVTLNVDATVDLVTEAGAGYLTISGTRIVTVGAASGIVYSSTGTSGMVRAGDGTNITINGQVLQSSATGRCIVSSGSGAVSIINTGSTAVGGTGNGGRCVEMAGTGGLSIDGDVIYTGGGSNGYGVCNGSSGTHSLNGNLSGTNATAYDLRGGTLNWTPGSGVTAGGYGGAIGSAGLLISSSSAVVNVLGNLATAWTSYYYAPIAITLGTFNWLGERAIAAGTEVWIQTRGTITINLATASDKLTLANSGRFLIQGYTGTATINTADVGAGAASIINQSATAKALIHGNGATDANNGIITGPTLPAANKVKKGEADYGYAADPLTPDYYPPNLDADPGVEDAAAVLTTAHYGEANAIQGTGEGGGGYTYGDEDASKVLTTATGTGTYQPVAAADVRAGTNVGVSPAVGTLAVPAAADVRYGEDVDDTTGTCYVPAAADVQFGVNVDATTGTFTSPPVGKVIEGTSWGAGGVEFTGTYHACLVGEVLDSVSFGASSAETGTYHAPDAAEVISTAVFGVSSGTAGTYDVTNVSAGNIKDGVSIGGVEGTYDPMAAAVFPAEANVSDVETAYGPTGVEYAGSLDMSLYTLISGIVSASDVRKTVARYSGGDNGTLEGCIDSSGVNQGTSGVLVSGTFSALSLWIEKAEVVSADYVVTGNYNYTGGSPGTYPTTATSKAEQLQDDKDAVDAAKASILDTETILTITGTFDLAAAEAAAASAQHATDAAFLETNKDEIIPDGTDILGEFGVTGTAVVGGGPLVGPSALVSC